MSVGDLAGQPAESNPFAGAATFYPEIIFPDNTFLSSQLTSPEIINELSLEKKGAWMSLNLEQVFGAGFPFKRSFTLAVFTFPTVSDDLFQLGVKCGRL